MAIEYVEKHKAVRGLNGEMPPITLGLSVALRLEVRASGVHCVGVAEVLASLFGFPCAECFGVGHSGMVGAELLECFVVGAGIGFAFTGHRVLRDVEQGK